MDKEAPDASAGCAPGVNLPLGSTWSLSRFRVQPVHDKSAARSNTASPHNLRVVKVRAHTGVMGYQAADRLTQEAQQGRPTSIPFEAMGPSGRGPHWIQYRMSPQACP